MEYKFGICDEDYHYVVNLMEFVNSNRIGGLSLVAFSNLNAVVNYLEKSYLDGVLVGKLSGENETIIDEESSLITIFLTENKDNLSDGIYKYQSAHKIVNLILERLNVSSYTKPVGDKTFFAVYSPLGRCGKTTLAKGLGRNYRNALYVSFEEFGDRDSLGEEVLYHIIFENAKLHNLLGRIKPNEYGLTELKGILSYLDIRQLTKEKLQWFKEQIFLGAEYDRVIFDIGSGALADLNILQVMDWIYVPVLEDDTARVKLQAFKEVVRCKEYMEIGGKIQYLEVPICHYASQMMTEYISEGEL